MAKILFAWELGGGLGHLLPIRAVLQSLLSQGNQVFVMVPDLSFAVKVFESIPVTFLQAPVHVTSLSRQIEPMRFRSLRLHDCQPCYGFGGNQSD